MKDTEIVREDPMKKRRDGDFEEGGSFNFGISAWRVGDNK